MHKEQWLDPKSQMFSSVLHFFPLIGFPPGSSLHVMLPVLSLILINLQSRTCFWLQNSLTFLSYVTINEKFLVVREVATLLDQNQMIWLPQSWKNWRVVGDTKVYPNWEESWEKAVYRVNPLWCRAEQCKGREWIWEKTSKLQVRHTFDIFPLQS